VLSNNDGDGGCSFIAAYTGGPVAHVRGLRPRVGGRLALFCIRRVNRVYGALVVTSWTCYGALYAMSQKTQVPTYLLSNMNRFQQKLEGLSRNKPLAKLSLKCPLHLKHVLTLPWEI